MKYPVYMHQPEIDLIEKYIFGGRMLEWGCGGSTLHFSKKVDCYHSIEHDWEWYSKIYLEVCLSGRYDIQIHHVPNHNHFTKYITYPDKLIDPEYHFGYKHLYNYILIDGRFRTACAIKALDYLFDTGLLFFHDFFQREYYWHILDYYELIDEIKDGQTLAVLRKK